MLTVVGVTLLGLLIWLLLSHKSKTEIIAVCITNYDHPFPPNAWAREDIEWLRKLEPYNVSLQDLSDKWNNGADQIKSWRDAISQAPRSRQPLIVYLSMHGIVDDEGSPCLVQPESTLWPNAGLVRVIDLLTGFKELVPNRPKLLVLDCQRILVNWRLGILENQFFQRAQDAIQQANVPKLAVLMSAGKGQRSWSSADLNGSPFGRFLQLGLAGEADAEPRNGQVSVRELASYVRREVGNWTAANRGERQVPTLLPEGGEDFRVTWTERSGVLTKLRDQMRVGVRESASQSPEAIGKLWNAMDTLSNHDPVRFDPIVWRDLEHRLLWLEAMAGAGSDYRSMAQSELESLQSRLTEMTKLASNAVSGQSLPSAWASFTQQIPKSLENVSMHSLPLCVYFGQPVKPAPSDISALIRRLSDPKAQIDKQTLGVDPDGIFYSLDPVHFCLAARRERVDSLWARPNLLSDVVSIQNRTADLATPRDDQGRVGDERAHYFVRAAVDHIDARRRELEDSLFIGELNARIDVDETLQNIADLHDRTAEIRRRVEGALRIRDRAWSQLPYLAYWYLRDLGPETRRDQIAVEEDHRKRDLQSINQLIRDVQKLSKIMDRVDFSTDSQDGPLSDASLKSFQRIEELSTTIAGHERGIAKQLDELHGQFQAGWQDLLSDVAPDTFTFRAIDSLLAVPLIPHEARQKLLEARAQSATALHKSYLEEPSANDEEPTESSETWAAKDHPLLALLQVSGGSDNETTDSAIRSRLATVSNPVSSIDQPARDVTTLRQRLSRREQEIRWAASVGFPPLESDDPVYLLRLFDLQQLLLWHRTRVIEDGWYSSVPGEQDPYYVVAARDYRRAAERILPKIPISVAEQLSRQDRRLLDQQAARLRILAKSSPLLDGKGSVDVSLEVGNASPNAGFPLGHAAIFIRDDQGQRRDFEVKADDRGKVDSAPGEGSSWVKLPFPTADSQMFRMVAEEASKLGASPQVRVYFRGRSFTTPFVPQTPGGVLIDYQPHAYGPPRVTLFGNRTQRSSVVFVLDCSASMKEPILVRENQDETLPRLNQAKAHLVNMLRQLATRSDTRVGVKLFGHRLGWSKDQPLRVLEQPNYPKGNQRIVSPSLDVETLLELGRFDVIDANRIARRIDGKNVTPWGQSPLYLAIARAMREFGRDDRDTRKGIIAITDGENNQFLTDRWQDKNVVKTTKSEVTELWKRYQVPVHFLDFGGTAGRRNKEFADLADDTGGIYQLVTSGDDLLRKLRERLELDGFTVADVDSGHILNPIDELGITIPTRLNTPLMLTRDDPLPGEYAVTFQSITKPVQLEGGESVELKVNESGNDFGAIAYEESVAAQADLIRGRNGQTTGHLFRVHRPIRHGASVQFKVSIQQELALSHFTRRLKETWLEVTPLMDDSNDTGETYVFYDVNFEPGEPVPVLNWAAKDWPAKARRARIEFWCKERLTNGGAVSLRQIIDNRSRFSQFQPMTGSIEGVEVRVTTANRSPFYEISIDERHTASSPGIHALRVQFRTVTGLLPTRVVHRFDRETKIATHRFLYPETSRSAIEEFDGSAIVFATRRNVHDASWQLKQPLVVDVYDEQGLLPLGSFARPPATVGD